MKIGILQINICKDINENIIKISKIISNNNDDIFIYLNSQIGDIFITIEKNFFL